MEFKGVLETLHLLPKSLPLGLLVLEVSEEVGGLAALLLGGVVDTLPHFPGILFEVIPQLFFLVIQFVQGVVEGIFTGLLHPVGFVGHCLQFSVGGHHHSFHLPCGIVFEVTFFLKVL